MAKGRFRCSARRSSPIIIADRVAELFACYDETLKALVDKHAPYADVKLHAHLNAPWYDSRCQIEKQKTRRLERAYRRKKSEESFKAWRSQSQYLRFVLREQYTEYWSRTLSSNMKDPAALWSKIGVLINQPKATSDCETLHVGPSSNMAHQTIGAGSRRNNHKNVRHVT